MPLGVGTRIARRKYIEVSPSQIIRLAKQTALDL
jgi:hypothetical protein